MLFSYSQLVDLCRYIHHNDNKTFFESCSLLLSVFEFVTTYLKLCPGVRLGLSLVVIRNGVLLTKSSMLQSSNVVIVRSK